MSSLYISHMKWGESRALTEHVPFTCYADELFMKVEGSMKGG